MAKAFEVKFKLTDYEGKKTFGTFTRHLGASKSRNNARLAARDVAWHAKQLGLKADVVSSSASQRKPERFAPVRIRLGTNGRKTVAATA